MKKKILIIGPTPPPYNGMSVITEVIIKSSIKDDFNIVHLDIADRRPIGNIGKFDFINIWMAFKHFTQFLYLLLKEKPQLVYLPIAQNIPGYLRDSLFLFASRLFGFPTLIHLHGSYFRIFYEKSNLAIKLIINLTLKKVIGAIVLGKCLMNIFDGFLAEHKIHVVPNGIKDCFIFNIKKHQTNLIRILFLSNLCREKGIFEILEIAPSIISKYDNVEFIAAGEWTNNYEMQSAFNFVKLKNIHNNVHFTGTVRGQQKHDLLASSDIFLFPTLYPFEGQPLVILEAMSAGLPIIAYNRAAISESVIDNENGFVIESGNRNLLINKLLELISNPLLRANMGQRSRSRFLNNFTDVHFSNNMKAVFNKTIEQEISLTSKS